MSWKELVGWPAVVFGAYIACVNFYLSFLAKPKLRSPAPGVEPYEYVPSGVPLFGSAFLFGGAWLLDWRPIAGWAAIVGGAIDTGGVPWMIPAFVWGMLHVRRQKNKMSPESRLPDGRGS